MTGLTENRNVLLFATLSLAVHAVVLTALTAHRTTIIGATGNATTINMRLISRAQTPSPTDTGSHDHVHHMAGTVRTMTSSTPDNAAPERPTAPRQPVLARPAQIPLAAEKRGEPAAPSTPAPVTTAGADSANYRQAVHDNLQHQLRTAVAANFHYPLLARRHHLQGKVSIKLRIEADGKLSRLDIIKSSGHSVLDHAALKSLGRIARLPDAAGWLNGRYFDTVIPIEYRLLGS